MKQIKFALFSDFHYNEGRYISSVADLEAILKRANDAGVDFVLQAGDFCNNFPGSPEIFKTFLENEYGPFYFVALFLSVLFNFTVNRKFTFKSAANVPIAMLKVLGFYCVFTPLSIWWGVALTSIGWNEYLVLAFTMIINLTTEFLFNRFVVFGKSITTAEKKEK